MRFRSVIVAVAIAGAACTGSGPSVPSSAPATAASATTTAPSVAATSPAATSPAPSAATSTRESNVDAPKAVFPPRAAGAPLPTPSPVAADALRDGVVVGLSKQLARFSYEQVSVVTPDGQRAVHPAPRPVASLEPTAFPDVVFVRYERPELGSPAGVFDARRGVFSPVVERAGLRLDTGDLWGAPRSRWLTIDDPDAEGVAVFDLEALTVRRAAPCRRLAVSDDGRFLVEVMGGGRSCGPADWTPTIGIEPADSASGSGRTIAFPADVDRPQVRSISPGGRWMLVMAGTIGSPRARSLWAVDLGRDAPPERVASLADDLGWVNGDVVVLEREPGKLSLLDLRDRTDTPIELPPPVGSPSISEVEVCLSSSNPGVLLHSYAEPASRTVRLIDLAGNLLAEAKVDGEGVGCFPRDRVELRRPVVWPGSADGVAGEQTYAIDAVGRRIVTFPALSAGTTRDALLVKGPGPLAFVGLRGAAETWRLDATTGEARPIRAALGIAGQLAPSGERWITSSETAAVVYDPEGRPVTAYADLGFAVWLRGA